MVGGGNISSAYGTYYLLPTTYYLLLLLLLLLGPTRPRARRLHDVLVFTEAVISPRTEWLADLAKRTHAECLFRLDCFAFLIVRNQEILLFH